KQRAGLQYVECRKFQAFERLLELALHPQVEVFRLRIGASRRHDDETLSLRYSGCACEGERVVEVDLAECGFRAGLLQGGAEAAEGDVNDGALQLRLELVELDDAIGETGMLTAERPSRDGIHP